MTNDKDSQNTMSVNDFAKFAIGSVCVFGLFVPSLYQLGKAFTDAPQQQAPVASRVAPQRNTAAHQAWQPPARPAACTNYSIGQLADLTTFNPRAMSNRNGEQVCIRSGGRAANVSGNRLRVASSDNMFDYVYCRPAQRGLIRAMNNLQPDQQIYSMTGRLNVEVGVLMNTIIIDDCVFRTTWTY